jgi:hypothetical protein
MIINSKKDKMTTKNIFFSGCCLVSAVFLVIGCTKKPVDKITTEQTDFGASAHIQFYNAVVESSRNYLYSDGTQLNGNPLSLGSSFPATGYSSTFPSSGYSFVLPAGMHSLLLKDTLATTTQVPITIAETFQANTNYTIFAYDTITAPKVKIVQTPIVIPSDLTARVRFANFIYSSNVVPAIDIWSVKKQANVATGLQKTDVTDFVSFPAQLSDTLIVRSTGTTTALAQLNGFIPGIKKSYTFVFRGRYNVSTGTGAGLRTLSGIVNY